MNPLEHQSDSVTDLLADQRHRWHQGDHARVETYLDQYPDLRDQTEQLLDLVYNEIVLRQEQGDTPRLDEYVQRFPDLASQLKLQFEVHEALESTGRFVPETSQMEPSSTWHGKDRPVLRGARPAIPGFEILGELGRGGMGVVWKARHLPLQRIVALKMILSGAQAGTDELARFRAEAEAVARLKHPNIVPIYEIGEHEGRPWFSLEFVEGGTLARKLGGKPIPAHEAAQLVEVLARAMHYAHQQGIVHRDLKPANVLLSSPSPSMGEGRVGVGVPKITDFGLAKQLESDSTRTRTGAVMGTPSYMAPEQAAGMGKDVGPAADQYALGAILYELLTGRPPFFGASVLDTLEQVRSKEPVAPRSLQPKVPRDLETICLKCLNKEVPRRYDSALGLADDLRRFLEQRPILARRTRLVERGLKWAKRQPMIAALVGLTILLFALGVVGTVSQYLSVLEERTRLRNNLYVKDLNLAQQAWDDGNIPRLKKLLAGQEPKGNPDLRGFEWYYLSQLADSALFSGSGQHCVVFSDKSRYLAAPGAAGQIHIWDGRNPGRLPGFLSEHQADVLCLAFSPDGKRLASAGKDEKVIIWDPEDKKQITVLAQPGSEIAALAYSADGRTLAVAQDRTVKLWAVETGVEKHTLTGHKGVVTSLAFSRDGWLVSASSDQELRVWDSETGKAVQSVRPIHHRSPIKAVAFSPDGSQLASGDKDSTVIWSVPEGRLVEPRALSGRDNGDALAFAPSGKTIATAGGDRIIRLWDVRSGRMMRTIRGHGGAVTGLNFSPHGRRIAAVGADCEIKVWDTSKNQEFHILSTDTSAISTFCYEPSGKRIAVARYDKTVHIIYASTSLLAYKLTDFKGPVMKLAFRPDGKLLAAAGIEEDLKLMEISTGKEVQRFQGIHGLDVDVAFSPDGKRLAATTRTNSVKLWDPETGQEVAELTGHEKEVTSIAFSSDSKLLASASADRTVKLWDASKGTPKQTFSEQLGELTCLAFSSDSKLLAIGGKDASIRVWDVRSAKQVLKLVGHEKEIQSLTFSPDGRRLASGSQDSSVRIWDLATGQETLVLRSQAGEIRCLSFRPPLGQTLAALATRDRFIKLWEGPHPGQTEEEQEP